MTQLKRTILALAGLLAASLFASQLRADTIVIHDLTDDVPTITQIGTDSTITPISASPEGLSFFLSRNNTTVMDPTSVLTVGLSEPTSPGGVIFASDLLGVSPQTPNELRVSFNSDPVGAEGQIEACFFVFGGCVAVENGQPQDVAIIHWNDGTSDTIQIESDINESNPTPEPSSLLLLGTGLLALGFTLKKALA